MLFQLKTLILLQVKGEVNLINSLRDYKFLTMRFSRAVLTFVVATIIPAIASSQVAGGTVAEQQDYTFAVGLYRDAQYNLALQQFKNFLKNYPNATKTDEITFLCGECLMQERLYDSSLGYYEKVIGEFPSSTYYMRSELRAGEAYLQMGNYAKSEKLLKSVLSGSSDNDIKGESSYRLGQLFAAKDDYQNAIKYFELSYDGYPASPFADYAFYGHAWSYGKIGKFQESKQEFSQLITNYPKSKLKPDAIEKMGECDFFTYDYQSAINEFKSSIALSNDIESAEPALYYEGRAFEGLSQADSARVVFTDYLAVYPNETHSDEVRLLLAKLLDVSSDGAPKAIAILGQVSPKGPLYFDSRIEIANAYQAIGSPDTARMILENLISGNKDPEKVARANYALGRLFFARKNYQESQKSFVLAAKSPSQYGEAMKNAALSAAADGRYKEAKEFFLNSIAQLKGDDLARAHFDYAASLYASGDYAGAAQIYLTALGISTTDRERDDAVYMAAESFYRAGEYGPSLANYQRYLTTFPGGIHASNAFLGVAYSYFYLNDLDSAVVSFRKFIDANPNSPLLPITYLRLGDCYYYGKDFSKAIEIYETTAKKFENDTTSAYAWYQDGEANFHLGKYGPAVTAFEFVVSTYSGSAVAPEAQYAIGWVHFTETKYAEAISEFDNLIARYPGSPVAARALSTKGDAYYNQGKYADALTCYQSLLQKYPSSDYVDNAIMGMQYCLTVLGRSKEAEGVIDSFVREHPSLASVDRIYYKKVEYDLNQKKYSDAERDLKEFIVKFPRSSMVGKVLYNLAIVELNLGKEKAATGVLSDLLDRRPTDEYTTAGKIKLAELYQAKKGYTEAERLLKEAAASADPNSTGALVDLGKLYLVRQDTASAKATLLKAAQVQTDSASAAQIGDAKILLSGIYFNSGSTQEAISLANTVASSHEDMIGARAQLRLGEYYCALGDSTNAVLSFLKVKYVFASFSDIVAQSQLEMADCVAKAGNLREARRVLQDLIESRSEDSYTRAAREQLKNLRAR